MAMCYDDKPIKHNCTPNRYSLSATYVFILKPVARHWITVFCLMDCVDW